MRVLDVPELGYSSALIKIGNERLLLLSSSLSQDDRVDVMLGAMDQLEGEL